MTSFCKGRRDSRELTMWESPNYIWFEEDKLGSGATASVYRCRHKNTGDLYAVKVLNNRTPAYVNKRECDILKALKHENVVSLLALEECITLRAKVIIMEYCNEGCLQSFLSKTENAFGLCETDLLAVLRDLVSGMKYMRSQNIAHRDIKPLNILRTIRDDGVAVHKLADFGGSRVLKEDECFESLVGTEEYLHPDMYSVIYDAGMFYRKAKKFKPTVDLWSFGVTMYYCITGKLPFIAHLGRHDKDTMFRIISTRSPNHISGVQKQRSGEIEWSSTYPETCKAPRELLEILLPIQRGVFDTSEDTPWSFDYFFDQIIAVLKRKKIQAVDVFGTALHRLYLPEDCSLGSIQQAVSAATGIQTSDLLLLCNNIELDAYAAAVSFGDNAVLESQAGAVRGASAGGPVFAFSRGEGRSKEPKSTVLLRVELKTGMATEGAIAAAQRLLFAAQEASDTCDLINNGMLALLAHQRQLLMAQKAALDRSPLVGASGKHRVKALSQLSSSTTQFHDLLLHFTKTFFLDTPYEVYNKDMALTDAMKQWEDLRKKVEECVERHEALAQKLSERPEDEQVAQKWKDASSDILSFNSDVSRIKRLCQDLVLQSERNKVFADYSTKYRYARKLFDGDIDRINRLYSGCQRALKSFEERLTAWVKNIHEPYTECVEQTVKDCYSLASSHEQLTNEYDMVTKVKDEYIRDILRLIIQVQDKSKDTNEKSTIVTTATDGASCSSTVTEAAAMCSTATDRDVTSADAAPSGDVPTARSPSRSLAAETSSNGQPLTSQTSTSTQANRSLQRLQNLANRLQRETNSIVQENKRLLNQQ